MATVTKNYSELSAEWWYSNYTNSAGGFVGSNYPILTGRFDSSGATYLSKAKFVMPSFSNFYKTKKIVLHAELADCWNANPKPCEVFLSEKNFTADQIVTYSSSNKYGISSTLTSNSLARSYSYADQNGTAWAGTSHSDGYDFYYILDTDKLEANKTYYLYFLNNNPSVNGGTQAHLRTVTFDYTEATKVTNPSINTSSLILKPSSSVTVSWSASSAGTNNAVSKYKVYWKVGSAPTASSYTGTAETTSTSCNFNISNATRGSSVYVGVQAIGTLSGLDSSLITKNIGVINSLPEEPTVLISGDVLNSGTNITFTVYAGDDANTGQTKTLCYNINGTGKKSFTSPLTIKLAEMASYGITTNGKYTIEFFTRDSLGEDSIATSVQFTANFKPIISSSSVAYTTIKDGENNELASKAVISFSLETNTTVTSDLWVRSSSTTSGLSGASSIKIPASAYTLNNNVNPKTITIDIIKIPTDYISYGHYFQFSFAVNDGNSSSDSSLWLTSGKKPLLPQLPILSSIQTDAIDSANAYDGYFKNQLTVKFSIPQSKAGCINPRTCTAVGMSNGIQVGEQTITVSSGRSYSIPLTLSTALENATVDIYLHVTDAADQNSSSVFGGSFIKTGILDFSGTVEVSQNILKPLTSVNDFKIEHRVASSSGSKKIGFQYQLTSGGTIVDIDESKITSETLDATIYATLTAKNMQSVLQALFGEDPNTTNTAAIIVTATDSFGQTKKITSKSFTVDYIEPPVLNSNSFVIYHDYDINGYTTIDNLGSQVPVLTNIASVTQKDLSVRMFNAKEGIILGLPKAVDPNDDITHYEIHLARKEVASLSDKMLDTSDLTFVPWLTIDLDTLKRVQDDNYYYYRYRASNYENNEYFYFKAFAKDSKNNVSEERISNTFIIGARTSLPTFSVGEVKVNRRQGSSGYDLIELTYNLEIQDLGGSATSQGWNKEYYNHFPNFEREISGYVPKISLQVEISSTPTFTESYQIKTNSGGSPLLEYKNETTTFENFPSGSSKVYARFTLLVSYGLNSLENDGLSILTSASQVITYFGMVPTISHRSHKMGINSSDFGDDDVLVVENYQNNRYVIFKGVDQTDPTKIYTIEIDLLKGTINGATISGGSWD